MSCLNDAQVWTYAEGGLDAADRAMVDDHLSGCVACQASLRRVQTTRGALRAVSSGGAPEVDWRRADDAVMSAATERFARSVRWRAPVWAFGAAAVAACVAVGVWQPWSALTSAPSQAVLAGVVVESMGSGTSLRDANQEPVALVEGGGLPTGSTLSTTAAGATVIRLPEQSRARLAPKSSASIVRATQEEIALRVQSGTLTVKAAHAPRREFVVDAAAVQVRVVGTAFRVQREPGRVVIAVAEGRVLVEPKNGQSRLVDAGHRVVVMDSGAWTTEEFGQQVADTSDFAALGVAVARAEVAQPSSPVALAPAVAPAPPHDRSRGTKPQKLSGGDAAEGAVAIATPEIPEATPPAIAPTLDVPPTASAVPAAPPPSPTTAEGLFLSRAQQALKSGRCRSYQLGLQDVVEGSEDRNARETAQILRARCFDEQLEPDAAIAEYKRYLEKFPGGRFAAEARKAIGD